MRRESAFQHCVSTAIERMSGWRIDGQFVPPGSQVAVVAGMLVRKTIARRRTVSGKLFRSTAPGKIVTVIEGHEDEEESFRKPSTCYEKLHPGQALREYCQLSSGLPRAEATTWREK
jgi:hypothetical protein